MNIEVAKALCRTFPGCIEDIKWGVHLVFSVGDKMFAITDSEPSARSIRFKVEDARFLELTDRPGIVPAPHLARAKWVRVDDIDKLGDKEAAELLRRSYELVFAKLSKTLQRKIRGE